jgi:hypothetical protein
MRGGLNPHGICPDRLETERLKNPLRLSIAQQLQWDRHEHGAIQPLRRTNPLIEIRSQIPAEVNGSTRLNASTSPRPGASTRNRLPDHLLAVIRDQRTEHHNFDPKARGVAEEGLWAS